MQGISTTLLSRDFCQRELALVHWARYTIAAIESGPRSTMYASFSFTRYKKGLSAMASPDFFFPLTWPQMISYVVFLFVARFMSTNSTEAGSSIFAATVIFAFFITVSSSD